MSLYKKISALGVAGLFILGFLVVPFAVAQDSGQSNEGGSGLQLSPTRTEIGGQPGESKDFTITLKNVTGGNVTATAFVNDFESDNVSGTPKIIVEENAEPTPYSIKDMIQGLGDVQLKADESKEVKLSLDIPSDAKPGAYFGAIRYAAVPEGTSVSGDRQVSLTASVAHLVFLEVPGDVVQQLEISSVSLKDASNQDFAFFEKPSSVDVALKNLGNGFSRPLVSVIINRGSDQIYSQDLNTSTPKGVILPQSSRVFTGKIENIKMPGKYTVVASAAYSDGGEVITYEKSFWYLPLWFLAIVAVVLIGLVVGGIIVYKKYVAKKFGK